MDIEALLVVGGFVIALGVVLAVPGYFLARHLNQRGASPTSAGKVLSPETSLVEISGFVPEGFTHGVELLNDNQTPMQFVVEMLQTHLSLSKKSALSVMLSIHAQGGTIVKTGSFQEAVFAAQSISRKATEQNHPLVCRAVRAQQGIQADAASPRRLT